MYIQSWVTPVLFISYWITCPQLFQGVPHFRGSRRFLMTPGRARSLPTATGDTGLILPSPHTHPEFDFYVLETGSYRKNILK